MKENLKFWLLASALAFFSCFPTSLLAATLSGPERPAEVGHLQKWKSDIKGSWMVFPPDAVEVESDTDAQTVYFVPLRNGTLYLTFFYIEDGTILHDQIPVPIGAAPGPGPEPDPEPSPEPSPSPVVKKLTAADRQALAASLEFTISSMESGKIRTVQGARSTFKQSISAKASVCNGVSCRLKPEISEVLDAWTEEADFSTLETTRKSFEHFLEAVK